MIIESKQISKTYKFNIFKIKNEGKTILKPLYNLMCMLLQSILKERLSNQTTAFCLTASDNSTCQNACYSRIQAINA